MRFSAFAGRALVAFAIVPLFLCFIIQPYDTMGTAAHNIREPVAWDIFYCALIAALLLLVAAPFLVKERTRPWRWKHSLVALIYGFLLLAAIARAGWMQFHVLNQVS